MQEEIRRAFRYKKAAIEDLDQLVQTRMIVLRAANELAESVDMTQVEKETKAYYKGHYLQQSILRILYMMIRNLSVQAASAFFK